MRIAYTIISINDDRAENKARLRKTFHEYPEAFVMSVDGRKIKELAAARRAHPDIKKTSPRRLGELGIWFSQLNAWKMLMESDKFDHLIVLEDDAIPTENCAEVIKEYLAYLPEDYDMLSLWVPENQKADYYTNYVFDWDGNSSALGGGEDTRDGAPCFRIDNSVLANAYQGYGGVATIYSKKGAEKFYALAKGEGLFTTSDCFLFINIHRGIIKGYAPRPDAKEAFGYNWHAPTNIQDTPFI
jgi:GR25 family glycosyltransferase involved in LPS biosynthesis